jgi:hypothetical protein
MKRQDPKEHIHRQDHKKHVYNKHIAKTRSQRAHTQRCAHRTHCKDKITKNIYRLCDLFFTRIVHTDSKRKYEQIHLKQKMENI